MSLKAHNGVVRQRPRMSHQNRKSDPQYAKQLSTGDEKKQEPMQKKGHDEPMQTMNGPGVPTKSPRILLLLPDRGEDGTRGYCVVIVVVVVAMVKKSLRPLIETFVFQVFSSFFLVLFWFCLISVPC